MKRLIRMLSAVCAMLMITAAMASGCSSGSKSDASNDAAVVSTQSRISGYIHDIDISKAVELKMYLIGSKPKDADLVYDEVNRILKQDINATVTLSFLSWGDWQQKYPLIFAAGERFDLIYTANWTQYGQHANKGAFAEITREMLEKYAPRTAQSMYPEAWEQAKINGKVYMLPMNYKEIQGRLIMLRGDIMDQYNVSPPTKVEDQADYYDACLKVDGLIPTNIGSFLSWYGMPVCNIINPCWLFLEAGGVNAQYYYDSTDKKSVKLIDYYDTHEYIQAAKLAKEWADKGYWPKSALVNKVSNNDSFVAGKSGDTGGNLGTINSIYPAVIKAHPEWKVRVFDSYYGGAVDVKPYIQNGMAINKNSKNMDRSLVFLDLLRNDRRYFDLTFYGIEGKHYALAEDGRKIRPLADSASFGPESCSPWGWRNDKFIREVVGGIPNYEELRKSWVDKAISHPIQNFSFDDSEVKNEIVAVSNVQQIYGKIIDFGFAKDVEKAIDDFKAKLKAAGRDRITAEMQAQIDRYMRKYK